LYDSIPYVVETIVSIEYILNSIYYN
jgi:hypothetical protein